MSDIAAQTERALEIREAFEAAVSNIPGITGTAIGLKYVKGIQTDAVALVAFVQSKGTRGVAESIPENFRGFPTDVVEATLEIDDRLPALADPDFKPYDPLKSGCAVGPGPSVPYSGYGTLGPLVYDFKQGCEVFLAAQHVFVGRKFGDSFHQPHTDPKAIGSINQIRRDFSKGLDYVTLLVDSAARRSSPEEVGGDPYNGWAYPELGSTVQKRGATTGMTTGIVEYIQVTSKDYKNVTFVKSASAALICDGGDSGATVVNQNRRVIGTVLAKTREADPRAVVGPYANLIKELDVNFSLDISIGGGWRAREHVSLKAPPRGPTPSIACGVNETHMIAKGENDTQILYASRPAVGAWSAYSNLTETLGFQSYWTPGLTLLPIKDADILYIAGLWNDGGYTDAVWIGAYNTQTGTAESQNLKSLKNLSSRQAVAITSYRKPVLGVPDETEHRVVLAYLDATPVHPWIWVTEYSSAKGKITDAAAWSDAKSIPGVTAADYPALAVFGGELIVAYRRFDDRRVCIKRRPLGGGNWSKEEDTRVEANGPLSMTRDGDRILIICNVPYRIHGELTVIPSMMSIHPIHKVQTQPILSPSLISRKAGTTASMCLDARKPADGEPSQFLMLVTHDNGEMGLWRMPAQTIDPPEIH